MRIRTLQVGTAVLAAVVTCSACGAASTPSDKSASARPPNARCIQTRGAGTAYFSNGARDVEAVDLPGGHVRWEARLPRPDHNVLSISIVACKSTGYVLAESHGGTAALVPISLTTAKFEKPIPVGLEGPVAISPNGSRAYVANSGNLAGLPGPHGSTVTPVNLTTNRALPPIHVGGAPGGIAVTRDGKTLLVSFQNNKVSAVPITAAPHRVDRSITLPTSSSGDTVAGPITIDPVHNIALVGNLQQDLGWPADVVNVINLNTYRAEPPIVLGGHDYPSSEVPVVSSNGRTAFALGDAGLRVIDLTNRTSSPPMPGIAMAMGPRGETLYVCEAANSYTRTNLVAVNSTTGIAGPVITTLPYVTHAFAVGARI